MSIATTTQEIRNSVSEYEDLLNRVSDAEFQRNPKPGVWSYSEVFTHIFRSNMLCQTILEKCSKGEAVEDNTPTKWIYRLVLYFRRYPPTMKFKVPKKFEHLVEKVNRDEARQLLETFRQQLPVMESMAVAASPTQKVKHPRMGLMNAEQWMMFMELHTKHHARQLKRIGKQLARG